MIGVHFTSKHATELQGLELRDQLFEIASDFVCRFLIVLSLCQLEQRNAVFVTRIAGCRRSSMSPGPTARDPSLH